MNIKSITPYYTGDNQNDGKGHDIGYTTNDGKDFCVEVKATKAKLKEEVLFEMSANEYDVMLAHKDTYFIYFIDDLSSTKIIKRISGRDIVDPEPSKYKVRFKISKME